MKSYVVLISLCGLMASAETTLELLQQRADAGDAAAQTFLGIAYFYGYSIDANSEKAQLWFGKAADQGDEFAAKRLELWGKPIRTGIRISTNQTVSAVRNFSQPGDLQSKVTSGATAPYEGKVSWDELVLHRNQYVGKVIELEFKTVSAIGGSVPYIYVRDARSYHGQSGPSDRLYLHGESALEWRLDTEKKSPDSVSKIYALVEKDGLIGLGVRQRKADDGYSYSW